MRRLKAILMMMALVAALGSVAYAHDHDDDNDNRGQNQNASAREYGYHNGYRDGYRHGREDRGQRAGYDMNDDRYQSGMGGYESYMGPRGQYKKGYREGYKEGYNDSYNGRRSQYNWTYGQNGQRNPWDPDRDGDYHNYPNNQYPNNQYPNNQYPNNGYPNQYPNNGYYRPDGTAQKYGYQDGLQAGQRDRAGRHSYRPTEWDAYKDADHGMSISKGYGSSDNYKQAYRQAFMNGYNQGYRR